ncbi:MAG: hypothetical protein U0164_18295 [Gemmatimonadaceae bacterium]
MNDIRFEHDHPAWDLLNDLADRGSDAAGASATETAPGAAIETSTGELVDVGAHVASCAECQATVASIRALSRDAAALERRAPPPPALWGEIAQSIAAGGRSGVRDSRAAPARGAALGVPPRPPRRTYTFAPRTLAAAALVLMTLTAGVTALVLRTRASAAPSVALVPTPSSAPGAVVAAGGASALPASFAATESSYLVNLAALHAAFVAQRSALSPATVAVVEHSLATIDSAIAEARAALIADPANQSLAELLSTTYQQKVELLRRATEYAAS